jgi:hypothetical protein
MNVVNMNVDRSHIFFNINQSDARSWKGTNQMFPAQGGGQEKAEREKYFHHGLPCTSI